MAKEPEVLRQSPDQKAAEKQRIAEGRPPITDNEEIDSPSVPEMEAALAASRRDPTPVPVTVVPESRVAEVIDRRPTKDAVEKRRALLDEVRDVSKRTLLVRATQDGSYDGFRAVGTKFLIHPDLFSRTWMERGLSFPGRVGSS